MRWSRESRTNSNASAPPSVPVSFGLVGLREQADSLGGTLDERPRGTSEWVVECRLPIGGAA